MPLRAGGAGHPHGASPSTEVTLPSTDTVQGRHGGENSPSEERHHPISRHVCLESTPCCLSKRDGAGGIVC